MKDAGLEHLTLDGDAQRACKPRYNERLTTVEDLGGNAPVTVALEAWKGSGASRGMRLIRLLPKFIDGERVLALMDENWIALPVVEQSRNGNSHIFTVQPIDAVAIYHHGGR